MTVHLHSVFLAAVALSLSLASACSDKFVDCEQGKACLASGGANATGDGDSDGTGGDEGEGGAHSGGATTSGDGDGDTSSSGGMVIDPCDACEGETPVCVDEECVACSREEHGSCTADEVCTEESECVSCIENAHCQEPDASVCDLDTNECTGCSVNDDCAHIEGKNYCEDGACVECTPESDERAVDTDACGTGICDPETFSCNKQLTQSSQGTCSPCIADAECLEGRNCIPLQYTGGSTPVELGGFCMKTYPGCSPPFQAGAIDRVSLSGATATNYCGLAEQFTTCHAIADLVDGKLCAESSECGTEQGEGRCETVNGGANKQCTYSCTLNGQCVDGAACNGPDDNKYCGG